MYHLNEITELETLINKVQSERFQLHQTQNDQIAEVLNKYFNYFKELTVKVSNDSAYFYMYSDEDKCEKEIYNLYFYERYSSPTTLQISYYSSSSNSEFELDRLVRLGNAAMIIKLSGQDILKEIDTIKSQYKHKFDELYEIKDNYEKQKRSYQKANDQAKKAEIEHALKSIGIVFSKGINIQIKSNYTPTIDSIRLTEVSKSGKTGTIVYRFSRGGIYTEQKVNIERILDQILFHHKDIVEEVVPQ